MELAIFCCLVGVKVHYSAAMPCSKGESNLNRDASSYYSPAAREKDLLPPPSLEHQNPLRPRSKPPSGKTAPRKEPRSATNSNNNTVTPPAALQQTPVPIPAVSANQVSSWGGMFVAYVGSFFIFLLLMMRTFLFMHQLEYVKTQFKTKCCTQRILWWSLHSYRLWMIC